MNIFGTLLLRLGFALHDSGMVRSKNASGAIVRKVADLAVCALAFWVLGAAIASPEDHWFLNWRLIASSSTPQALLAVVLIASVIPGAALGERSRFMPLLAISLVLGMFVVPLGIRWTDGFLGRWGMRDPGYAAAVHLAGAIFALVGTRFVGPRQGKYNLDGSSNAIPGHSMPLASFGVLVILLSWVVYLGTTRLASVNVLLSASAGILASLVFCHIRYEKPDIHLIYAGLLGALVAIVPGAESLATWKAVLIGGVAGVLVPALTLYFDLVLKIDDVGGGIAVHGVGAIWGLLATAILSWDRGFGGFFKGFGAQLLGLVLIAALAVGAAIGLFTLLSRVTALRSKEADEYDGLDLAEHDVGSYPDFQQTMIKSYHLREA